jgi:hypothetical protein
MLSADNTICYQLMRRIIFFLLENFTHTQSQHNLIGLAVSLRLLMQYTVEPELESHPHNDSVVPDATLKDILTKYYKYLVLFLISVAKPHHVDAAPGESFDSAPAPAHILLHIKPTFF